MKDTQCFFVFFFLIFFYKFTFYQFSLLPFCLSFFSSKRRFRLFHIFLLSSAYLISTASIMCLIKVSHICFTLACFDIISSSSLHTRQSGHFTSILFEVYSMLAFMPASRFGDRYNVPHPLSMKYIFTSVNTIASGSCHSQIL